MSAGASDACWSLNPGNAAWRTFVPSRSFESSHPCERRPSVSETSNVSRGGSLRLLTIADNASA
ncbi:MAG: hypothetical protein IJS21_05870, partial [Deltaproteobacteria bacterium]|nr:hypothetical protein [Deltaproteobacteria bacterium]